MLLVELEIQPGADILSIIPVDDPTLQTNILMAINEEKPMVGYSALWVWYNSIGFAGVDMFFDGVKTDPIVLNGLIAQHCAKLGKMEENDD